MTIIKLDVGLQSPRFAVELFWYAVKHEVKGLMLRVFTWMLTTLNFIFDFFFNLAEIKRHRTRGAHVICRIIWKRFIISDNHSDSCFSRAANREERVIPHLSSISCHVTTQASPFHLVDRSRCLLLSLHQLEEKFLFLPLCLPKKGKHVCLSVIFQGGRVMNNL